MCRNQEIEDLTLSGEKTLRCQPAPASGIGASTPAGRVSSKEKYLISGFIKTFSSTFYHIETEVTDQSRKSRIDVIVYITQDILFGIEFKQMNDGIKHRKHGKDLGEWMVQSKRYSESLFPNVYTKTYSRIPIFVFPEVTNNHLRFVPDVHDRTTRPWLTEECEHNNVNSFLFKAFQIGELRILSPKHHMIFSANCLTVADLNFKNDKWTVKLRRNKYRILCNHLNISPPCQS
jgi:hypothetical protein